MSKIKSLSDYVQKEYPQYVSGDDNFSTITSAAHSLRMVIDRIEQDEQALLEFAKAAGRAR